MVWLPSIGPSGLLVYTGNRFANWKLNVFVGSVRRGENPRTGGLERVVLNDKLQELRRETLLTELHQRIRDVRQGPDGLIYVLTDEDDGALLRLEPEPTRGEDEFTAAISPGRRRVMTWPLPASSTAGCWVVPKGAVPPSGWTSISLVTNW